MKTTNGTGVKRRLLALALAVSMAVSTAPMAFADEVQLDSSIVAQRSDSGVAKSSEGFTVEITDKEGNVGPVEVPGAAHMKVLDGSGNVLDKTKYSVEWGYITTDGDLARIAQGVDVTLTYTSLFTSSPSYVARVTKLADESFEDIEFGKLCNLGDTPYLLVNGTAVRPGAEHAGVSLSADGKTVTLNNVDLDSTIDDPFGTPALLADIPLRDVKIVLKGDNSIKVDGSNAIHLISRDDTDDQHSMFTIEGGGSLTAFSTAGSTLRVDNGKPDPAKGPYTDLTIRNVRLNLSNSVSEAEFFIACPLQLTRGGLIVENSTIVSESDAIANLDLRGVDETKLQVKNSTINIVNTCTAAVDPDKYGSSYASGIYYGGAPGAVFDNSNIKMEMKSLVPSEVYGLCIANSPEQSKIINRSNVDISATNQNSLKTNTEVAVGIRAMGLTVDNSKVKIDINTGADATPVWGIVFSIGKLDFLNNADVNINLRGGGSDGLHYYYSYDTGTPGMSLDPNAPRLPEDETELGTEGTINISNANVNINCYSNQTEVPMLNHAAIWCRYLNLNFTSPQYALNIKTDSALGNHSALLVNRIYQKEPISYEKNHQPQRLLLSGSTKVLSPASGEVNWFSYHEREEDKYFCNETVYGADKTKPAASVRFGYSGTGGGSSSGKTVSPLTFNFDWASDAVKNGAVDAAVASKAAAEAVKDGKNYLLIRNASEISPDAFAAVFAAAPKLPIYADTTKDGITQLRQYLNPALGRALTGGISLGGSVSAPDTKERFEKYYDNKIAVVRLAQNGTFGMAVGIAARVDLTGLDTSSLYFYSYNRATGKYYPVKTSYFIDANGFLHFTTTLAGDIIITDKPLTEKA